MIFKDNDFHKTPSHFNNLSTKNFKYTINNDKRIKNQNLHYANNSYQNKNLNSNAYYNIRNSDITTKKDPRRKLKSEKEKSESDKLSMRTITNFSFTNLKPEIESITDQAEFSMRSKSIFSDLQNMYSKNISDDNENSDYSEYESDQEEVEYESVSDLMMKILDIEDETKDLEKQLRMEIESSTKAHLQEFKLNEEKELSVNKKESIISLNLHKNLINKNHEDSQASEKSNINIFNNSQSPALDQNENDEFFDINYFNADEKFKH